MQNINQDKALSYLQYMHFSHNFCNAITFYFYGENSVRKFHTILVIITHSSFMKKTV